MSAVWLPPGIPTLPRERLVPWAGNPNKQSPKVFKKLVDSIQEDGFLEPLLVTPMTEDMRLDYLTEEQDQAGGDYWLIVGGHHRWEAAGMLDMTEIPVVIKPDWDEDMAKLRNVRMNALKGKLDPSKFQELWAELREKGYEEELLKEQMGLVEERAFKSLLKDLKEDLPAEVREKLDDREDLHTVDDLERVLQELLSVHGDTLPYSFLIFEHSGKTVAWVKMDDKVRKGFDLIAKESYAKRVDINRALSHLFFNVEAVTEAMDAAAQEAEEEVPFD